VSADGYLLDNRATEAEGRFAALSALFDPVTFRHVDALGVAPGWRCWEVGAGGATGHLRCKTERMPEEAHAEDRRVLDRLALGDWPPGADAQVVSVTVAGGRAEVALLVNGDYGYWMYFQREDQAWCETASGNGPTNGWDDPTLIEWADGSA
jgi:hypothetical protein